MKISVVVPTYKRPKLLLRCIDALLAQRFESSAYEIIIVSDGFDEETAHAIAQLKKHGPNVRLLSLPTKGGPAAARNLGWRSSRSKLVAFTDDDCIPDANWLGNFWTAFLRTPGTKSAFTGRTIVPVSSCPTDYERNIAHLADAEFITANCACTRAALSQVNGFDEEFTMAWREDSELQFKFLEHSVPIVKVPGAVVTHPVRKAPWGISIKDEKKGIFNALLFKKYPELYKKRIQPTAPWHYYAIVLSMLCFFVGIFLSNSSLMIGAFAVWASLTVWFTIKRLRKTAHTASHVSEMVVTSVVIPFLSLFYRIYGAIKFRSPLLP